MEKRLTAFNRLSESGYLLSEEDAFIVIEDKVLALLLLLRESSGCQFPEVACTFFHSRNVPIILQTCLIYFR
jgi:hypothetical protein